MIAFLAVTTVINIALGYALAVYLGQAQARPVGAAASAGSPRSLPTRRSAAQEARSEAPAAPAPSAAVPQTETSELDNNAPAGDDAESRLAALDAPDIVESPSAVADKAELESESEAEVGDDEHGDAPAEAPPAGVEKDLLAGIEEFRSQLAQLKGEAPAENADPARPVAAATA